MMGFPETEPKIEIVRLDEPPFEIECRELRWWFMVLEEGEVSRRATYDYPQRILTKIEDAEAIGRGKVHGVEATEIRYRHYSYDGELQREAYAYGTIQDGKARWLGWWNLDDNDKLFDWTDYQVDLDWPDTPIRIVDRDRFLWVNDSWALQRRGPWDDPEVDPIGAGIWLLRVGGSEHRCIRVLDVSADSEGDSSTLCEGFINEAGRVLLSRRYNAAEHPVEGGGWREKLQGSPTLTINETVYYLWYDCLSEAAL